MAQATANTSRFKGRTRQTATERMKQAQASAGDVQRQNTIATRAYRKAEARGFAPGCEEQDWLDAEREVVRPQSRWFMIGGIRQRGVKLG